MPRHVSARRRCQSTLILSVFALTVSGAAFTGWWYARESAPHQGPIVLVSVDGLDPGALLAADSNNGTTSSIGALAADAVVFERAYTHSPLTLPALSSLLAGQLPFEHGVRDEAGFTLHESTRSLAELLRNRGFETGAAVSSFLLRRESGVAQGFSFFDAELPEAPPGLPPAVQRDGTETMDAAAEWLGARRGHRYFLFLQVSDATAEATVARLVTELEKRGLYDQATIVLTADRGAASTGLTLDDASLHVPLLVKQPDGEGAGRYVAAPVQHIDILPTILDLVRAPVPSGLRGRSLRALLDDSTNTFSDRLIYAESMAGQFRFGSAGMFALASPTHRYVRGSDEQLLTLTPEGAVGPSPNEADEMDRLRGALDRLLEGRAQGVPTPIAAADEERFAALGYLGGPPLIGAEPLPMTPEDEAAIGKMHRSAALLVAQGKYSMAVDRLRRITRAHPELAVVQYQAAILLSRAGRLTEAEHALSAAAAVEPDNPYIQIALTDVLLRAGREADATDRASIGVALAEHRDGRARAAAHQMAAMVALARGDGEGANRYAEAAEQDDPGLPLKTFIAARLHDAEGRYEAALASFEAVAGALGRHDRTLEGLQWHLGNTLAKLGRGAEAEKAFHEELRAFPGSIRAYSSLAILYHESDRPDAVQETLEALLVAVPTPEGYNAAARMWATIGDLTNAAALRTDARARFRDDPAPVLLERRR